MTSSGTSDSFEQLKKEFPDLDAHVIVDVYRNLQKDTEETRRKLTEIIGTTSEPDVLEETIGDLFTCEPNVSMCHCVSEDLAMGKGIATEFKRRFKLVEVLKAQKAQVGQAAILQRECPNAFVYYLVTKKRYFHKPTIQSVQMSCEWMKQHTLQHNVRSIAMPRIGCGLDKLSWNVVRGMLIQVLRDTGVKLVVYTL